ncbi:MAG: GldG family protein, partial [Nitrospinales bacterium]
MKKFAPYAGWMTLFFGFAALFFYIITPNQMTLVGSLGAIALVNLILFILLDWTLIKQSLRGRAARYGINTVILSAIFLGILVFANLLTHRHKYRFDITEGGYYTLAPQTRKIVSTLPRKVQLTAFYQADSSERDEFKNLIEGYLELTDKIDLKFIDPDKNPAITKQYGVTTYGTVAFESGKQETKVKAVTEESLTNALLKVIRDDEKTIYFLSGHGEKIIDTMDNEGYSTTKSALEKSGYKVKKLLLLQAGAIPEDADLVVINGPDKPILKKEIKVLEGYLDKGGSLFILVDPKTKTGLDDFLKAWGIELSDDIIIDPLSKLFGGDYAAPVISKYSPHDITKEFILATIFPVLRSVSAQKVEGIQSTEL